MEKTKVRLVKPAPGECDPGFLWKMVDTDGDVLNYFKDKDSVLQYVRFYDLDVLGWEEGEEKHD